VPRVVTCAKGKSTSLCLSAVPAFDRIAGLYNRHLNSKWGIAYAKDLKNNQDETVGVFIREKFWLENSLSQCEGGGVSE